MSFINLPPRHNGSAGTQDQTNIWRSTFCSGCGNSLVGVNDHRCLGVHGMFCTQCGQRTHPTYVCSPDVRKSM